MHVTMTMEEYQELIKEKEVQCQKGCGYCENAEEFVLSGREMWIHESHNGACGLVDTHTYVGDEVLIKYCPFCGKKLGGE